MSLFLFFWFYPSSTFKELHKPKYEGEKSKPAAEEAEIVRDSGLEVCALPLPHWLFNILPACFIFFFSFWKFD